MILVDFALGLLQAAVPGFAPAALRRGKFLAPILPGERIEVRYRPDRAGGFLMACFRDGETVASFTLAAAPP